MGLFTITGNIINILDFRDSADCLDTYLKIASKRVQLMNKSQNMHSAMQHIPEQKLKRYFRKETGFYQLLQHAALHPPLCNLSWAVGRDRGGLATSLMLLWWEKQWQKENVHLPCSASCRLWACLFMQRNGLLCSWPSYWRGVFSNSYRFPLAFSHARRLHRHTDHGCCCCAISNTGEDRSSLCEGSCTYMQQFGNVSGKGSCLSSQAMWSWSLLFPLLPLFCLNKTSCAVKYIWIFCHYWGCFKEEMGQGKGEMFIP